MEHSPSLGVDTSWVEEALGVAEGKTDQKGSPALGAVALEGSETWD